MVLALGPHEEAPGLWWNRVLLDRHFGICGAVYFSVHRHHRRTVPIDGRIQQLY